MPLIRPATPPEVKRSPMASRDPTQPQDQPEVGPVNRREWSGYIVWGILAVIVTLFELLASRGANIPFPTLSETVGNLQARHNWTSVPILAGLVVLAARIVFYPWPFGRAES